MKAQKDHDSATHAPTPWLLAGLSIYSEPVKKSFGGPERIYLNPVCCVYSGETEEAEWTEKAHGADHYNERLPGYAEAAANAEFIVRAVNSHAALVAALEEISARVPFAGLVVAGLATHGTKPKHTLGECMEIAAAALALARGNQ
jgi:hypothetical protein